MELFFGLAGIFLLIELAALYWVIESRRQDDIRWKRDLKKLEGIKSTVAVAESRNPLIFTTVKKSFPARSTESGYQGMEATGSGGGTAVAHVVSATSQANLLRGYDPKICPLCTPQ